MMIGLVGKPNSGKSSMLKALTAMDVKISPVPFTTIDPNIAIGHVIIDCACKEFGVKCNPKHGMCRNGKRFVPVRLIDVAGLVPGAHEGRGMGNQFLDNLRSANALIHVVDCSGRTDSEGKAVESHDPMEDITFLENEIDLWFASVISKAVAKHQRQISMAQRSDLGLLLTEQLSGLEIERKYIETALDQAPISNVQEFARVLRRIAKPILIAANKIDVQQSAQNYQHLKEKYANIVVPTSAEAEITLKRAAEAGLIDYVPGAGFEVKGMLTSEQQAALDFLDKNVIQPYGSTGVQNALNKAVFELLNYIAAFPVADRNKLTDKDGRVLPDVLLVPAGTTVKEFAFRVHTDIGENFICGIDVRSKRRLAADAEVKNGDIIEIMFKK